MFVWIWYLLLDFDVFLSIFYLNMFVYDIVTC
jgi:hypothetical protein